MIVGMDFGTTNSGMALYDGQQIRLLPLDPANRNPNVIRTAVYVTNQQGITIGREAVDNYFAQNIGRSIKLQQVWVGEVEVIASEVYYVEDLYVWTDVLSPGRLFLSIKSGLRDVTYAGTVIGQFYYSLEDLVTLYLTTLRMRAEQMLDKPVRKVVLGRPVHFSFQADQDEIAQSRLLMAALEAGFEEVYFEYEPIAAAYLYEMELDRAENVLVFDFGGGTLDITIARLGGGPDERRVLATGGIPIAGDIFDQRLSRAKLPRHFGEGSIYGSRDRPLPVPVWFYDVFSDWQRMIELQKPENIRYLDNILQTSRNPGEIQALRSLVSSNYGLQMFDQVERAKRQLSERISATIKLEGEGFKVFDLVTRSEFENIIHHEIERIQTRLRETVEQSGLAPEEIQAVICTGGSSQIPVFQKMLARMFGEEKLKAIDTFSSVTAGLSFIAHQIEKGAIRKTKYDAPPAHPMPATDLQQRVPEANLSVIQRRIQAREQPNQEVLNLEASQALVLLDRPRHIHAAIWEGKGGESLASLGWKEGPPRHMLTMPLDDQLVVITNRFRFLLTSPRQLLDLQALNLNLDDLYYLVPDEQYFVAANWTEVKQHAKMVVVGSTGYVRAYDLRVMIQEIEGPVPYKFDQPPDGWPLAYYGGEREDTVALLTDNGRAVSYLMRDIPNIGGQVLKRADDELIVGVARIEEGHKTPLLALTHDGYGRLLTPDLLPAGEKLNTRGGSVVARNGLVGLAPATDRLWAVTTERMLKVDASGLAPANSTRTEKVLRLRKGEAVTGLLQSSV